ncbi:MAG: HAD family hydrolase [Vicinamibacterales bacterium]
MTPDAILFDLYGTLVRAADRPFSRGAASALGVSRRAWITLLRGGLLTEPFPDTATFARHVARALAPDREEEAMALCLSVIAAECASVELVPGTPSLLAFLKRRNIKLGLVSNLATPFKDPVVTLGLAESFDTLVYSCDERLAKPDAGIYHRALERLGVSASATLFVGDNLQNDVEAPAELGMRTIGIGVTGRDSSLASVADLGLLDLSTTPPTRLLGPGDPVEVGPVRGTVRAVDTVADGQQGRYNLVYRCVVETPSGTETVYAKRFLLPETVHVEVFAYELQALTGLPACRASRHPGREDLLLVSTAPGRKWEHDLDETTAYALGGHFVFALLFSNADIRPRNAFVDGGRVTMVDLEHCFFNLAIDTSGLEAPERPETFDRMPADELAARTRKKVLSSRATSRARRSFFTDTVKGSPIDEAFHAGFIDYYKAQQGRADEIADTLRARLRTEPPLVVGTHGYRRALAQVDVQDILSRLQMDAQVAYEGTW